MRSRLRGGKVGRRRPFGHEFFGMGAVVAKAKEAVRFGAAGLRRGFGG